MICTINKGKPLWQETADKKGLAWQLYDCSAEAYNDKIFFMTFNEMIQSEKPVLVDFFAEWCGPCKTMAPILKDVKDSVGEAVTIIKVDVDKNPQAAQQFQVQGVPTLILFKKGKPLWRQSGVMAKSGLMTIINQYK